MLKIKPYTTQSQQILGYVQYEKEESPAVEGGEISPVVPSEINIENWLDVSNNAINYKMSLINGDAHTIFNLVIPYDVITSNPRFNDQTFWTVKDSTMIKIGNVADAYTVTSDDIVNIYDTSFVDKDIRFSAKNETIVCPLKIFVPSKTSSITDLVLLTYSTAEDSGVITTVGGPAATSTNVVPFTEGTKFATQMMATISITASEQTTAAGDQISLQVEVNNPDITEVFVDPIYGSVNKTRIPLTNGIGSVLVSTDGMNSGEKVKVKFGWYSYTGVASFNRTLS